MNARKIKSILVFSIMTDKFNLLIYIFFLTLNLLLTKYAKYIVLKSLLITIQLTIRIFIYNN
jgi:hypothetical protein